MLLESLQQGWQQNDAAIFSALGAVTDGWESNDRALFAAMERMDGAQASDYGSIELLASICPLALAGSPGGVAPHRAWAQHDAALFDSSMTAVKQMDEGWIKHDAELFASAMALIDEGGNKHERAMVLIAEGWEKHDRAVLDAALRYPEAALQSELRRNPAVSAQLRRRLALSTTALTETLVKTIHGVGGYDQDTLFEQEGGAAGYSH